MVRRARVVAPGFKKGDCPLSPSVGLATTQNPSANRQLKLRSPYGLPLFQLSDRDQKDPD